MARRSNTVLLATCMLSLGLAAGGHLNQLSFQGQAQATLSADTTSGADSAEALVLAGDHLARLYTKVMPAVVHVQAVREEKDGRRVEETGSGVVMRSRKVRGLFVITNNHVIRGADVKDIELRTADGRESHPIRIYRDEESDLAVMQIQDQGAATGQWGDSNRVSIGHFVIAVGSPFGLSESVSMGIVSAKGRRDLTLTEDRPVTNQDFLQTDAAINPGNSGGPLIDMQGHVVGINTAIASNSGGSEGVGFSIPSNLVQHVFEQLVSTGEVRRAYLGVELDNNFTTTTARRLGLEIARGARITRVYRSQRPTPAAMAGMKPDDVIVTFNGIAVVDENHLINLVSLAEIGKLLKVEVIRTGRRQTLNLQLSDRDSYRTAADSSGSFLTR